MTDPAAPAGLGVGLVLVGVVLVLGNRRLGDHNVRVLGEKYARHLGHSRTRSGNYRVLVLTGSLFAAFGVVVVVAALLR